MQKDEKQQIAARLKDYCAQKGSQNKAANSMNGVSAATVSKVLAGDWDTISDEMSEQAVYTMIKEYVQ